MRPTALKLFVAVSLLGAAALVIGLRYDGRRRDEPRHIAPGAIPIGMMGDSDTKGFQDDVSFPPDGAQPGGAFHAIALQWPEVLAAIRPGQVDLGPVAVWGVPRWMSMARVRDGLRLPWRGPRYQTHQHNLAWASGCETLLEGPWRQTERLIDVMDEQPEAWRRGVVIIRIGVNNFGKDKDLEALSANPDDVETVKKMTTCAATIGAAVAMIHASHPQTRIILVGIGDNIGWVPYFDRWHSAAERRNINRGIDHFDGALRALARADSRLAFFDDRAWFKEKWGDRNPATGQPDYLTVHIGGLAVRNTAGDNPENAILANLHAGLVWNVLWTQSLVALIRSHFGLAVDAISDDEASRFVAARVSQLLTPK